jgi:hypothetical protein
MGVYSITDIENIIVNNPNKKIISKAQAMNSKLMMHLYGQNVNAFMKQDNYFENADVYKSRVEKPMSNKDLWERILNEESIIFAARGGSARFNLSKEQEEQFNAVLSNVRYNISLRKWIETFALPAYRSDPMGLIFIEVEQLLQVDGQPINTPKCYPTYKSIQSIHDYQPNGRTLEYVCFHLFVNELAEYGINDKEESANISNPNNAAPNQEKKSAYYRFVDSEKDVIVKQSNGKVIVVSEPIMSQPNPVANDRFNGRVPAFIISDLIHFDDPNCFASPISQIVELADGFLYDRSIRDLQKKYHGFAKTFEPLVVCSTCSGVGQVKGSACPDCTIPGQNQGTGYKLKTKVGDVLRFPMKDLLENTGFDVKKIFGYVAPPIDTWDKQDLNLVQTEQLIYYSYWGCAQTKTVQGPQQQKDAEETATKTEANLRPKYARLNKTCDWVQTTINDVANLMGLFWFDTAWKGANIIMSRNFILESPEDLLEDYLEARKENAPDFILDELMMKYINANFQDNPLELAKMIKLFEVNPFVHATVKEVEDSPIITDEEKLMKRYFSEWSDSKKAIEIIDKPIEALKADLRAYAATKKAALPKPATTPTLN